MDESLIVILNFTLYAILFLVMWKRYGLFNVATVLGGGYGVSSLFSTLFFFSPLYPLSWASQGTLSAEGMMFLFIVNMLLITSFRRVNFGQISYLNGYDYGIIHNIQKILTIVLGIYVIINLPLTITHYLSNPNLSDLREATYEGQTGKSSDWLSTHIAWVFNNMDYILFLIATINILLLKEKNKLNRWSIAIYVGYVLCSVFGNVARVSMVFFIFDVGIVILAFHNYFSSKRLLKLTIFSSLILYVFFQLFFDISKSRFGSNTANNNIEMQTANLRYAGEAQLNFMGLMYPNLNKYMYGFYKYSLVRRILNMEYPKKLRKDADVLDPEVIKRTGYKYPTFIFHSLVGGLYLNWGPYMTFIIALLLNIIMSRYYNRLRLSYMKILITCLLSSYILKGIFYDYYTMDSYNFMLLFLILIVIVLNNQGHRIIVNNGR